MAEYQLSVRFGYSSKESSALYEAERCPYWAQSPVKYAQNLLEYSDEPIEYDHHDSDYSDNCFFFPEDCSWSPPPDWILENEESEDDTSNSEDHDTMIPGLPDIKMLDAEALSDLLEDNLSPPEITTILYGISVFGTNGAIFAYASSLPSRQLRNLSATYGAAYTAYAKNASSGNLTGVNPASHPSSYVTAQSVSLGDVGSIVFELDELVAVVTRIADKVLLAAVGPSQLEPEGEAGPSTGAQNGSMNPSADEFPLHEPRTGANGTSTNQTPTNGTPNSISRSHSEANMQSDAQLETQYEIDRSNDLARLASLNLSSSPSILLALESKSAALGKFLSQKLEDLESPEDF
ncbi:hypothetical protein ANOM_005082 [Aspergillus nomiae NRRL 13137]|uniref:Uncharacterized protein n=1 Tax=Aspergillus nomiae NRRL (strain ATCC 15546 / NRRL 13137 / CBS 260.88 / M93) TaxID=1509407 RepID=A0A0L1J2V4_ASPN3|nr:uncharacterized protein ANOM_005082 [Aspergillus nomiae NRRL 13137]KNG85985.1 hypothetical protein ANOM_005082 [Aspergillus nomiae NRRL 13137]